MKGRTHAESAVLRARAAEAGRAGMSVAAIASAFGYSASHVRNILREAGVRIGRGPRTDWPAAERTADRWARGDDLEDIAALEGVTKQRIHQRIRRLGIESERESRAVRRHLGSGDIEALCRAAVEGKAVDDAVLDRARRFLLLRTGA